MGKPQSLLRFSISLLALLVLQSTFVILEGDSNLATSVHSVSPITSPTFSIGAMNASMRQSYAWAMSRVLPNGTATLQGESNNLLSTSVVGRVLTYLYLEVGNTSTKATIRNMINAEHALLQNPKYISYGVWSPTNLLSELQIHRDAQKFLLRAYGLTLNQTARADLLNVTQNIYLNMPNKFEYFDTISWGLANAVWFAYYSRSPLPPTSDFATAVQDLNTHYNLTAAKEDSTNPAIDFFRLLHYMKGITYTDSYFRLEGNSLNQTYLSVETQLANQLVRRQLSNGNISTLNAFKSYLVEDFARDLDTTSYLNNNLTYVYSAYKAESFLTGLYLQSNGNFSEPKSGEGTSPTVAFHMLSIANDIRSCSSSAWYSMLSSASKLINYTVANQSPDGTFRFYLNVTNPGFAYTTITGVSAIVDSYLVLRNTNVLAPENQISLAPCIGQSGPWWSLFLFPIPSWLYIALPIALIIVLGIVYEAKHRSGYRGLVGK